MLLNDGRNIRWIIPYSPGGGYDEYARLLGPFLEKYTGMLLARRLYSPVP
jgi:tripartite-type tricarboxylate transporter receptor subunit TctC